MTKQKSTEEKEHNKGSFKDRYKKCLSELKNILLWLKDLNI